MAQKNRVTRLDSVKNTRVEQNFEDLHGDAFVVYAEGYEPKTFTSQEAADAYLASLSAPAS